jgi:lysophospholipase L1-like esterase
MRPVFCLFLLAVFLVDSSATPAEAAIQTDFVQPPIARFSRTYIPESIDTQYLAFLPLIISPSKFLPTCQEIHKSILTLFGSSLVSDYPLWETSGKTVVDLSPNKRSGAYEGNPSLSDVPALCENAPRFDGVDDSADVYSAGLASAFNGDEGTVILQVKIEKEEWIDGKAAFYLALRSDSNNNIEFYKSANNQLEFAYTAGGTRVSSTINDIATDHWVTYAITWSKSNKRFFGYVAGESIYPAQTGLGVWAGKLTSAEIAGYIDSADSFAKCSISSVVLLNREATPEEIREYSAIFGATKVLTVLGDSISRVYMSTPWSLQTVFEYDGGNKITLKSHAVSGQSIIQYMDGQTIAAALDDADIIIIALGTVDDNAGDMSVLQAEVEENITELKLSNPRATLYYLNVLPYWTDKSGRTEIDKSNIRAAIAAACIAQSILCWDTYTNPWITAADTYDGVHPNAAGQKKIANQVLKRIP